MGRLASKLVEKSSSTPSIFQGGRFRNELPDPTAQPKLLSLNTNKDQYTKYTITSLEKMHKPKLFVEPDLGIPLDLLDISVYNPPSIRPPLDPEDEELLRDAELTTPVKQDGIRRKERPTDKGVSWLVKTQYISPLSMDAAKTSLTEKQAKELRETRGGRNLLENLNDREKQIQAIEASFEACKSRPVHATNNRLQPVEILPLLPDFDRYEDQFVLAAFDSDPTADSEVYSKLNSSVREEHEAQATYFIIIFYTNSSIITQAIMKSFVVSGSDPAKAEKFLAYMAPSPDELWKDIYDENEDVSYSWVREYHWDVRGDDADDPTTYLVAFDEAAARYLPLPTKLVLRKKRAKEGRSADEVEYYPVPSSVTVRKRPTVAAVELKDSGGYSNSKGNMSSLKRGRSGTEDGLGIRHKVSRVHDMDNFSGAEDEMSD
ncbi:RNA polymerase II-associated [Macleaya cordata]|uniref:RNA polymerase II-associated n=1 Tax=Macleaya cordata TaxID=56857 RepID=A0A200QYP0_MACCD|nr:RNA polymerase II-associated [Macleaya cordata]